MLALRELAGLPLDVKKVSPIIEPLKTETKSIVTMIKAISKDLEIQLIVNPEYGDIKRGSTLIFDLITSLHNLGYNNIIPSFPRD